MGKLHIPLLALAIPFLSSIHAESEDVVTVRGKVVDAETGKPITAMMIQAGKRDAKDPEKITWGYSHRNTRSKSGSFSTTIRWDQGWTARIVADGYIPQPIITQAPKLGQTKIEVEIQLKKGKPVTGLVVDHLGKPVEGAKVFAVSPRGLNLCDGEARDRYDGGKIDDRAKYVKTDKLGSFKIHPGTTGRVVVCAPTVDAFVHTYDLAEPKPATIKLPAPAIVKITYDIPNAEKEIDIFYQFLSYLDKDYKNIESTRTFKLKNGNSVELKSLPPGKYQFVRQKMHHFGRVGMSAMLDRTFIEIKPGKTTTINFVRDKGKQIEGTVRFPEDAEIAGAILSVISVDEKPQPWSKHKNRIVYSSQLIAGEPLKAVEAKEAAFKTESLSPGKYLVKVIAYKPMTPAEMALSGIRLPDYEVITKEITVTESGAPNMLIIPLKERKK